MRMSTLMEAVKRRGGISPQLSTASQDLVELGAALRAAGIFGVVSANGKGRDAEDLICDLDPDIQAEAKHKASAETGTGGSNHVLLDALAYDLRAVLGAVAGRKTPTEYIETLEGQIHALEQRLAVLETDYSVEPVEYSPAVIRDSRLYLDLTQEQACRRLGISAASINRWENGKSRPVSRPHVQAVGTMIAEAIEMGFEVREPAPF